MLGIDLTTISRFQNVSETFIKKLLHNDEIHFYQQARDKAKFLAARWAIKEALYKIDNQFYNFSQVLIVKKDGMYHFKGFEISTSRENDFYIAIVQKEK